MAQIDIQIPDIGDFDEVAVIELLVKVGDTVAVDQSLITVESDKASMEIPSSHAGVVTALKVKLGDKVKQGSVILSVEATAVVAPAPSASAPASAPASSTTVPAVVAAPAVPAAPSSTATAATAAVRVANSSASSYTGAVDVQCDLLVLGGGPGGYSAAFRAADLGLNVVIVERYAQLGGVCLNVGCIPSKALLHVAAVMDEVSHLSSLGVDFGKPKVNIDMLRGHKEKVIGKLTGGLAAMAKMRKVRVLRGYGAFVGSHHVAVEETTGTARVRTPCTCPSCPLTPAWLTAPVRCNSPRCPSACSSWAAASSAWKWARSTARWAPVWMWWR